MEAFWIAVAGSVFGAIIGGGGVTIVVRLALTESLRKVFADKDDVVTPMTMHEKIGETHETQEAKLRQFAAEIRTEFESKFGSTAGRLEREHNSLKSDLERAIGALDQANRSLREEGVSSAEAVKQAALAKKEVEGLTELYKALSVRLGRVESDVEGAVRGITEISRALADLKAQLAEVLKIAPEKRRTGGSR